VLEILSPLNKQTVMPNTNVWVEVNATDNVGMREVKIRIDRQPWIILAGEGPYGVTWNVPSSPGKRHRIAVMAVDLAGNTATTRVRLRVANVQ
jgi:hypothetical protein